MLRKKGVLFCEMNPLFYKISEQKEILKRHLKNMSEKKRFCHTRSEEKLPVIIAEQNSGLIKRGKGIDPVLQENKAVNIKLACEKINGMIIHPGEVFSFWRTVGKTTRRRGYKDGRVLEGNKLKPGIGGGLCNLSNTIHRLVLNSPLKVTEFHSHSDALAPDEGKRVPFSSGTSVSYNYIDFRFENTTENDYQILLWCKDERLYGELRSTQKSPLRYKIVEEGHCFRKENDKYYRVSKIYRNVYDADTGEFVVKELLLNNHSEVMYDYSLIPAESIKESSL